MTGTHLLGPKDYRHHALRLSGLGALVNEDGTELHLGQPRVTSTHTCAAYDICILGKAQTSGHMWKSEDNFLETVPGPVIELRSLFIVGKPLTFKGIQSYLKQGLTIKLRVFLT